MVCSISCMISTIFIIGMIYFYNKTSTDPVVLQYRSKLPSELQDVYDKIVSERRSISIRGYIIGFIISSIAIYMYYQRIGNTDIPIVCTVLAIMFLTNYFYYMLSPKTDWMLNHMKTQKENQLWLEMYRTMQYHYHAGLALGILGVGILAFAFRC